MATNYAELAKDMYKETTDFINTNLEKAKTYCDSATDFSNDEYWVTNTGVNVKAPDKIDIKPFSTNIDFSIDFQNHYNDLLNRLGPEFKNQFDYFLNTFMDSCAYKAAEEWLCNTIRNGGTGIPIAIENAIYNRARDRENKDGLRLRDEAINDFSSRGFSLPNAALYSRLAKISSDIQEKVSQVNRDTAIKQVEIEIENIRFAVGKAIEIKQMLWKNLFDYLDNLFKMEKIALEGAVEFVNSKNKLYNSMYEYYDAQIKAEELYLRASVADADNTIKLYNINLESFKAKRDAMVKTALQNSMSMADVAKAAAVARNTVVSAIYATGS